MQDFVDRYQSYYDNLDETLKLQILRSTKFIKIFVKRNCSPLLLLLLYFASQA
jgi:hypothetical protein